MALKLRKTPKNLGRKIGLFGEILEFWGVFGVVWGCFWRGLEWFGVFWGGLVKADICMSYTGFNALVYEVFTI